MEAGHTISTRESYLGLQDTLRKVRAPRGLKGPGVWAGTNVCIKEELGVVVLTSQEKWDQLKSICSFWLEIINEGVKELDYKRLLSDWGFMVYVVQAYPGMKLYLKGFHLFLETWQEGCDKEGWKLNTKDHKRVDKEREANRNKALSGMEDVKINLMTRVVTGDNKVTSGSTAGFTLAAPCFKEDLEATILFLAQGERPVMLRI